MTAKPSTPPKKRAPSSQPLNVWIAQQLAPNAQVQMRLRGNILHVLCETPNSLHQAGATTRLVEALLNEPRSLARIKSAYPQVYQLYIYSRRVGQAKPDWTAPIYLNRLERHQTQFQQQATELLKIADAKVTTDLKADHPAPNRSDPENSPTVASAWPQSETTTAVVLSQISLAQQGDPDAIAWYLSEVLSTLDVGVWVSVRAASRRVSLRREAVSVEEGRGAEPEAFDDVNRLWVWCEATYSPDPMLIAEPVTERLRQLSLTQFKDAVIVIQVHGEDVPDWSLRIDLTPAEEMLREWARWGDEGAIARLMERAVSPMSATVDVERKDESLHSIVQFDPAYSSPGVPDERQVIAAIAPLLREVAPQGLHRVMVYGQAVEADVPTWVRCLNLPALEHPALAEPPTVLAQQGDLPALAYLLTRLLNPDLDAQLATGGIRIQVLQRDKLLHVMADAPVCPTRRQVVPQILDFLEVLSLSDIKGIRLYGRRAGQQRPTWSYGQDFEDRPELVPKAEPTFAVSDRYVGDLLSAPSAESLQAEQASDTVDDVVEQTWQFGLNGIRRLLIHTQLFVPQNELPRVPPPLPVSDRRDALKIGLVWSLVGALLTLQVDWILGQVLNPATQSSAVDAAPLPQPEISPPSVDQETPDDPQASAEVDEADDFFLEDAFPSESEFVADDMFTNEDLVASPEQSLAPTPDLLSHSPYPSFRSQQMDEKLALYHQRLAEEGPPDVLVIGSSRALRGVDPAALRRHLSALGYGDLNIFNFGVNGATAQVVDLTIRRILEPHQLPKIIVWADGARAFNSGRTDVTFDAIAASAGYQELGRRKPDSAPATEDATAGNSGATASEPIGESLRASYQALDQTLSDQLGQRSAIYEDRDQLKAFVRDYLLTPLVAPITASIKQGGRAQNTSDMPIPEGSRIDFDGFLALDARFNPATYYQLYARVAGAYDSDYESFELEGEQTEAFERLLDYTQSQDIPVVFVNTPLTDEYLDGYRTDAEEDFRRLMLTFSATEDEFIFRDLGRLWTRQYDYFSDPSHLNRYGAYQVSLKIAQDPMIPWPRASQHTSEPEETTP